MNGNSRSLLSAVRGPIMLIAVGLLFAADQFTEYGIWRTWPVLLILLGLLKLAERIGSSASAPPGGGV
jgi:hypothetical protein